MEFDPTKFSLIVHNVVPYLKIIPQGDKFYIYEGAHGLNRFQYFVVNKKTPNGKLCMGYYRDYVKKSNPNVNQAFKTLSDILVKIRKDSDVEQKKGFEAYYLFWKTKTENDIRSNNYLSIPHFEALKEWYNIKIGDYIQTFKRQIPDKESEVIEILRFKKHLIKDIEDILFIPESQGETSSIITSAHAKELFKFYEWLINSDKQIKALEELKLPGSTKPSTSAYAIIHVYLAKSGGQGITMNNAEKLGNEYGYKASTLLKKWREYKDDANRLNIHPVSKVSANTHMSHYESALSFLKTKDSKAFELCKADFELLKKNYKTTYGMYKSNRL